MHPTSCSKCTQRRLIQVALLALGLVAIQLLSRHFTPQPVPCVNNQNGRIVNATPRPQTPGAKSSQIPKIFHQTYSTTKVPTEFQALIARCLLLNPTWQYFLWRDVDIEAFIQDHFPQYMAKYKGFKMNVQRADIIRYMVLHHYGGIYLDMDVECVQPFFPNLLTVGPAFLDQERREHPQILYGREFTAMNSAMGAAPGHPFFLAVLSAIQAVPSHVGGAGWTTGPDLLTTVYSKWIRTPDQAVHPVTMLEPEVFSPIADDKLHNFRRLCSNVKIDQGGNMTDKQRWLTGSCKQVLSKDWKTDATRQNVTVGKHLFLHLGYSWGAKSGAKFDIAEAHPKLKMYTVNRMRPEGADATTAKSSV